ncbi:hypothetical protein LTR12_009577 [Friedmanniomyces endolithicus]|nr:hypothetical protein LTR74_009669 [Friedmanniomyces endolithicus]KAK1815980.1 hypothetical protein LTR12_009577 [Friedmanniomyces endolithicus]
MARYRGPRRSSGPKKPALTPFICLPLVTAESRPKLEASMKCFRDAVVVDQSQTTTLTDRDGDEGSSCQVDMIPSIHPQAIRPVRSLHCTLGVMSLDKTRLEEAIRLLQALDVETVLRDALAEPLKSKSSVMSRRTSALTIDLEGLVSMHPAYKTSILYIAPTDKSNRLYTFCVALQKLFADAGLLVPDGRPFRLHATIVNTIYAKSRKQRPPKRTERGDSPEPRETGEGSTGTTLHYTQNSEGNGRVSTSELDDRSQGHGPKANAPLKMDATALLARFENFVWAEGVVLDRVSICEMGAKKIVDADGRVVDEEYTEVASVRIRGATTSPRKFPYDDENKGRTEPLRCVCALNATVWF